MNEHLLLNRYLVCVIFSLNILELRFIDLHLDDLVLFDCHLLMVGLVGDGHLLLLKECEINILEEGMADHFVHVACRTESGLDISIQ